MIKALVTAPAMGEALLHPKYALPAYCFAYVGDANDPSTWKLPHLHADGQTDEKRLPKAIQALLSNYRGHRSAVSRNRRCRRFSYGSRAPLRPQDDCRRVRYTPRPCTKSWPSS